MIAWTGLSEFLTPDKLGAQRIVLLGDWRNWRQGVGRCLVARNLDRGGRDCDGDEGAGADACEQLPVHTDAQLPLFWYMRALPG
jgi:hypothetical protein